MVSITEKIHNGPAVVQYSDYFISKFFARISDPVRNKKVSARRESMTTLTVITNEQARNLLQSLIIKLHLRYTLLNAIFCTIKLL